LYTRKLRRVNIPKEDSGADKTPDSKAYPAGDSSPISHLGEDFIKPMQDQGSATMIASRIALSYLQLGKSINESQLYDLLKGVRYRQKACLTGLKQAHSYSNVRRKTELVLVDGLWTLIPKVES